MLNIVNVIRDGKGLAELQALTSSSRLREDCEMDSLDLAEFTVRVEKEFGIDVFADGLVETVGDVETKITDGRG